MDECAIVLEVKAKITFYRLDMGGNRKGKNSEWLPVFVPEYWQCHGALPGALPAMKKTRRRACQGKAKNSLLAM